MRLRGGCWIVGFQTLLFLLRPATIFSSIFYCGVASQVAFAESSITPSFEAREIFVDNEFQSFSETGNITTISPGVAINLNGAKSDFSMIYAFDAIRTNDLEQKDREFHELEINAELRHKPNQWASYVRAKNRLVNGDIDGVQTNNPDIIDINSEELLTVGAGTNYTERLSRNLQYSAGLGVDYADREDADRTSGREVSLSIDNLISADNLTWSAEVRRNVDKNEDDDLQDDQQIDELAVNFNYRFDQTLSAFLKLTATDTEFDDLNDDSTIAGLRWSPTRQSFVSVGIGKRGDEDIYDLNARITRSNSLYSASYSESVTSVRDRLFDQQNDQFGQSTQQSTSITPVLRKRADIAATFTGLRSSITFSIFRDEESNPNSVGDEETTGGRIEYRRRVSARSSLSFGALSQDTEFTEKSNLEELRVAYQKSTSQTAEFEIFTSTSTFESTNLANEYDQKAVGASYRVTF